MNSVQKNNMVTVSLVIPTYNEAKNINLLLSEIFSVVDKHYCNLDVIIVDDNSPDGTGEVAENLKTNFPLTVIHRKGKLGLGSAVREGFARATGQILGVMDADLSHDPAIINQLIKALEKSDIAIGSRFAAGSTVENWARKRKFLSEVGVYLARRLTKCQDPLSGYFFFKREVLDGVVLTAVGYKILLEILVKGTHNSITEVPFNFRMRKFSTSKLNYKEYLLFLVQLVQYAFWKLI